MPNMSTITEGLNEPWDVQIGRRWFQWRSFSPVPLLAFLIFLPATFSPSPAVAIAALLGVVTSEALRIWAVGCAGSATRTRGDTIPELVVAGPYRFVRNPLYVANIAMYALTALLFGMPWLALVIFVYSSVQYHFIVAFEESRLTATFGESYRSFVARVPRWLPQLSGFPQATPHTFSLMRALRSERSTLLAMVAMVALYLLKTSGSAAL